MSDDNGLMGKAEARTQGIGQGQDEEWVDWSEAREQGLEAPRRWQRRDFTPSTHDARRIIVFPGGSGNGAVEGGEFSGVGCFRRNLCTDWAQDGCVLLTFYLLTMPLKSSLVIRHTLQL